MSFIKSGDECDENNFPLISSLLVDFFAFGTNDICFFFLPRHKRQSRPVRKKRKTLPYLPLWWGWAPDCCRRIAGQPLQSVSSWCWARMGWAPTRFGYIPKAGSVQTPDLTAGPLLCVPLNPSDSLLMIFFLSQPPLCPPTTPLPLSTCIPAPNLLYPVRSAARLSFGAAAAVHQRHASRTPHTPPPVTQTALKPVCPPRLTPLLPGKSTSTWKKEEMLTRRRAGKRVINGALLTEMGQTL